MRMARLPLVFTVVVLTLVHIGCASTSGAGGTQKSAATGSGERRPFVFNSSTCLVDRGLIDSARAKESVIALLVGAIAPKVIDFVVNRGADALQRAAAAQTDSVAAKNGTYFHVYEKASNASTGKISILGNCVCVIVLDTNETWSAFKAEVNKFAVTDGQVEGFRGSVGLTDQVKGGPVFYYEAAVLPSDDKTAFQLRPALLYYGKSLATAKAGDKRSLNVVYTFRDLSGTALAAATLSLPDVVVGNTRGPLDNNYLQAPWMPVIALSDATKEAISAEETKKPQALRIQKLLTPFNLEASISETRDARAWLKAIADILGSDEVKGAAKTALEQTFIPGKGAEATAKSETSALQAERDLELANRDVDIACAERKATTAGTAERLTKDRAVVDKQFAANEKAIAAGKKKPFATPDKVSCTD